MPIGFLLASQGKGSKSHLFATLTNATGLSQQESETATYRNHRGSPPGGGSGIRFEITSPGGKLIYRRVFFVSLNAVAPGGD